MKSKILLFILATSAFAGYLGHPGEESFAFIQQFESANSLGRSLANTANDEGMAGVRRNPAALTLNSDRDIYLNYGIEYQSFTNASLGFSQPLWGAQVAVLLHVRTLLDPVEEIDENAVITGETHRPWAEITQWVVSYSPYPGLRIAHSIEALFSRLTQDESDPTAWGVSTGFGVFFQRDPRAIAWGFSINQMGKQFGGYSNDESDTWLNTEFNLGLKYRVPSLPRLTLNHSMQISAFGEPRLNNSLEYMLHRSFIIMAGFSPAVDNIKNWAGQAGEDEMQEIEWPFAGGVQFKWNAWQLNYSVSPHPLLNWHHQFTLNYSFLK